MFCAHAITVLGDMTVEISPFMKAFRVNSATVTILPMTSGSVPGFFAVTIAVSSSCGK